MISMGNAYTSFIALVIYLQIFSYYIKVFTER